MESEGNVEEQSDSDGSEGHDGDSDSSYVVSSDSQDEDFSVSEPAAPRNRSGRQKTSAAKNTGQESSSSTISGVLNDKPTESQPPAVSVRIRKKYMKGIEKKKREIRALRTQPGSGIIYQYMTYSMLKTIVCDWHV